MNELTQDRLKKLLHYNPSTGVFTWLKSQGTRLKGSAAGSLHHSGYIHIKIDWVKYGAHRLAFLYMTGRLPLKETDHINRSPADNRWENLREADRSLNCDNRGVFKNNKLGVRGVSRLPGGRFLARRRGKSIGTFATIIEAESALCATY